VQTAAQQPMADLMLSLFAYLYQVVKIPSYADYGSYLDCEYDTLENWVDDAYENDGEEVYRAEQKRELDLLKRAGSNLFSVLNAPYHLHEFECRLKAYSNAGRPDAEIEAISNYFLTLMLEYPQRTLFDNIRYDLINEEEQERITIDQYVGFYWSGNDCLAESLFEMIESEFNERGYVDEPVFLQWFDRGQELLAGDFDFEKRLFEGIDRLASLLNPYDNE
jgi:hypothetical protein